MHILTFPFNLLTYPTIPDPIKKGRNNLLPITFLLSYLWIFAFSFFATWWMAHASAALAICYLYIPFALVPLGLLFRDIDKIYFLSEEVKLMHRKHEDESKTIKIRDPYMLATFQMTVATSINWLILTAVKTTASF